MKKVISISFFLVLASAIVGGTFIQNFVAESDGENVILSWQSTTEENVKEYEILRGPDKDRLSTINKISAKGSFSSYQYIDETAYKTNDSFYAYALIIVDFDGKKSQPMHTFVSHNGVSSVKRTWGSIKALFR